MSELKKKPSTVTFDLSDLLIFLWQKKVRIILLAAVLTALGTYYVISLPRVYTAESTIMLSQNDKSFNIPLGVNAFPNNREQKLETHIQFMKSRQFAGRLVERLNLQSHPEFQSQKGGNKDLNTVAKQLLSNLNISSVSDTDMIKIRFESGSPNLTSEVANTVGPVFFDYLNEMSQKRAVESTRWLNSQLNELQFQLSESEEALLTFQRDNDLIDVDSQIDLAKTEISKIMEQKLFVDKSLSAARSITQQISTRETDVEKLLQIPNVATNDTVRDHRNRVLAQEQVLEEISKRYRYKHYKYKAAESALALLKAELKNVLLQIINGKQQDFESFLKQQQQLEAQLFSARERLNNLGKYELQLARMKREVEATRRVYEMFLSKMQETQILQDIGGTEEFAIVDYATEPKQPTRPRVLLGITLSIMFSSVFSAGFWLLIHLIRDRRNRFRHLVAGLGLHLLAEIPKVEWAIDKNKVRRPKNNKYGYDEAIRSLRTSLIVNDSEIPLRKIAVVSMGENEGRDEVAVALAESFSNLEKVLLIDCDLRTHDLLKRFSLEKGHPGIVNFINRDVKFNQCMHKVANSQLTFIPSGITLSDPVEHISKPRFASLIHKLSVFYERLILTAPAVVQYSDTLVLSQHVDGIVVICDIERSEAGEFTEGVRRLQDSGVTILGVVFNRVRGIKVAGPESVLRKRFFNKGKKVLAQKKRAK